MIAIRRGWKWPRYLNAEISAENFRFRDRVFFGGQNALFEQFVELPQLVCECVSGLNGDRKGHVGCDDEIFVWVIDFDEFPRGEAVKGLWVGRLAGRLRRHRSG